MTYIIRLSHIDAYMTVSVRLHVFLFRQFMSLSDKSMKSIKVLALSVNFSLSMTLG